MKLRMKMLVFIVVPVVILTAVSSFYSYYQSKAALEKQIMDTSNAQISYFSQELNRDLIVRESIVKNLAAIFSNKDLSTEEMLSLVTATKKGDSSLAEVLPEWQTAEEYLIIGHHRQNGCHRLDRGIKKQSKVIPSRILQFMKI